MNLWVQKSLKKLKTGCKINDESKKISTDLNDISKRNKIENFILLTRQQT